LRAITKTFVCLLALITLSTHANADWWSKHNPLRQVTPHWGPLIPHPQSGQELLPPCVGQPQNCRDKNMTGDTKPAAPGPVVAVVTEESRVRVQRRRRQYRRMVRTPTYSLWCHRCGGVGSHCNLRSIRELPSGVLPKLDRHPSFRGMVDHKKSAQRQQHLVTTRVALAYE
jgi:hypothetical protein